MVQSLLNKILVCMISKDPYKYNKDVISKDV